MKRADSTLVLVPLDGSAEQQAEFVQCRHCGKHHHVGGAIQSILARGKAPLEFCGRCGGPVCADRPSCRNCVPREQQLDNLSAGRDPLAPRPQLIAVP